MGDPFKIAVATPEDKLAVRTRNSRDNIGMRSNPGVFFPCFPRLQLGIVGAEIGRLIGKRRGIRKQRTC